MLTGQTAERRAVRRRGRGARRLADRAVRRSAHRRGAGGADPAALARARRAGRRRRQLGAHDLPRRQPAAAARGRSGQRLRHACSPTCTPTRRCSRACARGESRSSTPWARSTRASRRSLGAADRQRLDAHLTRGARDRDAPDDRPGRATTRPATIRRVAAVGDAGQRRLSRRSARCRWTCWRWRWPATSPASRRCSGRARCRRRASPG